MPRQGLLADLCPRFHRGPRHRGRCRLGHAARGSRRPAGSFRLRRNLRQSTRRVGRPQFGHHLRQASHRARQRTAHSRRDRTGGRNRPPQVLTHQWIDRGNRLRCGPFFRKRLPRRNPILLAVHNRRRGLGRRQGRRGRGHRRIGQRRKHLRPMRAAIHFLIHHRLGDRRPRLDPSHLDRLRLRNERLRRLGGRRRQRRHGQCGLRLTRSRCRDLLRTVRGQWPPQRLFFHR